jgi:hypothetical protein
MAYIPGFKHAIFISYAHLDNIPLSNEERGWINIGAVLGVVFLGQPASGTSKALWYERLFNDYFFSYCAVVSG